MTWFLGLFILEITLLFFLSRITINELFYFFRRFIHNERVIFNIITTIFLPGTILHEISHMIFAMILFLRIHSITIVPKREHDFIRLGSVIYEKTDVIRSIIVGIAPLFGGLLFFWSIYFFKIFPSPNIWLNIFMIYIIFTISSTMFSSSKDLQDLIYIIPFIFLFGGIVYVFNLNPVSYMISFVNAISHFIQMISMYLLIALIIQFVLIAFLKSFRYIYRR